MPQSWRLVVLLTAWGALVGGAAEFGLRLVARGIRPVPVFLAPQWLWMAPLANLALFLVPASIAYLVFVRRGPDQGRRATLAVVTFLGVIGPLLLLPRIHPIALAVLAAGCAAQLARLDRNHPERVGRFLRGSTMMLAIGILAGGVGLAVRDAWRERMLGKALPPAVGDAPNVILLVLDTVRSLSLSAYGYERRTSPTLERLSNEGVRFDRAFSTAPWTLPTHSTLFTGRYQYELSAGWSTPLDAAFPTLAERLAAHGYATGGFVANPRYTTREFGLGRGFARYRDYATSWSQLAGSSMPARWVVGSLNEWFGTDLLPGRKSAREVTGEFLRWSEGVRGRPYFAFLNLFDAHEPYVVDAPYDRLFADQEPPTRRIETGRRYTAREVSGLRDAYDGTIASLDATLDSLFAELERRGELQRTIVVITSDHGEEFMEHGHLSHGNGLHAPALHVPLIVRAPGRVPAGKTVAAPVTLRDVPATILALGGFASDTVIPGTSLESLWRDPSAMHSSSPILSELYFVENQPDWYPVAHGDLKSVVVKGFHYIKGPGTREALYDLMADPWETRDLLADPVHRAALESARAALATIPWQDRGGR